MNQPLEFPKIPPEDVRWRNQLLGQSRQIPMQCGSQSASLQWLDKAPLADGKQVQIVAGDLTWLVGVSDWNCLPMVQQSLGIDTLSGVPEMILLAVLEMVFEPQLNQVGSSLATRCELAGLIDRYDEEDYPYHIGFQLTLGEASVTGSVAGDSAAMAMLCDWAATVAPCPTSDVDNMPLVAPIEIGMTQLSVAELKQIGPGDVVVMDVSTYAENGRGLVRFPPRLVWRVHVEGDQVIFEESFESESPVPQADQLMLTVVAELGRISITAQNIAELAPEAALSFLPGDLVTLSMAGQSFATGELVKIGPKVGVRVNACRAGIDLPVGQSSQIASPDQDSDIPDISSDRFEAI
ncbi:hypothetical protein GC197_09000 [bacterium]|nr:hypothetical protein [bacterium]